MDSLGARPGGSVCMAGVSGTMPTTAVDKAGPSEPWGDRPVPPAAWSPGSGIHTPGTLPADTGAARSDGPEDPAASVEGTGKGGLLRA